MTIDGDVIQELRLQLVRCLGEDMVLTDAAAMLPYCRDWHGDVQGNALAVIRPRSTEEVSAVVALCRRIGLKIVPQGGNTGLVLGAMPESSERHVVISLERMNAIRSIDPEDFSAKVEAGCILSVFKDAAAAQGLFFPLTLGAQESCQIGGNVSTNAGGINVLRYGMMRDLVLGLEVVLPDGRVWSQLSALRKDNRGIDLKQLFIGAEGTLGIVTAATLKLSPLPTQKGTALLAVASLNDALRLYRLARAQCCDLMSAFEFMPLSAFTLAQEVMPHLSMPLSTEHPFYVLMEMSGSGLVDIADLMQRFLELGVENGIVADGVVASSDSQARNLWLFREGMVEGQAKRGMHLRTDVSVPLSRLADFVKEAEMTVKRSLPDAFCISYGHIGDGNVHLNVHPPQGMARHDRLTFIETAKKLIDHLVLAYHGSISAEHGIGRLKQPEFEAQMSDSHRMLLTAVLDAIDPEKRMNPGSQMSRTN